MQLKDRASSLGHSIPKARLHPDAVTAMERAQSWYLALSGGADSVALLCLVWSLWPQRRQDLQVLHFNHSLRGPESDADESFCAELCTDLGVSLRVERWKDRPPGVSEEAARDARFGFFDRAIRAGGDAVLLTAHHLNDVLETQLMRLARGAASAGLAAPRPVRRWRQDVNIARPLLTLAKEEIVAALRINGIAWREDGSNFAPDFARNRVRAEVVPALLRALGPGALLGAALSRRLLEEDDQALEQVVAQLGLPAESDEWDLRLLHGQPVAIWRRALRRWRHAAGLARPGFEALLQICMHGSGSSSVGEGVAHVADGKLWYRAAVAHETEWPPVPLVVGSEAALPDGGRVACRRVPVDDGLWRRFREGELDVSRESFVLEPDGDLLVRNWRPGDRYRPLGAPGSSKLQDLFTNRKIPALARHRIPVICSADGRILWVPGLPPREDSKVTPHSVTAVQLTYTPGTTTVTKQS